MSELLNEVASAIHDHMTGTIAVDEVDMVSMESLLGVDDDEWYVLRVTISILGGEQSVRAYGVQMSDGVQSALVLKAQAGEMIQLTEIVCIDWSTPDHDDTNPPPPLSFPITSASELLQFGFKRLQINLVREASEFPPQTRFEIVDTR